MRRWKELPYTSGSLAGVSADDFEEQPRTDRLTLTNTFDDRSRQQSAPRRMCPGINIQARARQFKAVARAHKTSEQRMSKRCRMILARHEWWRIVSDYRDEKQEQIVCHEVRRSKPTGARTMTIPGMKLELKIGRGCTSVRSQTNSVPVTGVARCLQGRNNANSDEAGYHLMIIVSLTFRWGSERTLITQTNARNTGPARASLRFASGELHTRSRPSQDRDVEVVAEGRQVDST